MKKAVWILCLALTMMATVSPGQEINDEFELTRSIIQTQRQAIVTAAMQLTGEESQTFWPLYHEYREAMRKVDDRSVTLINGYAESFDTMTDEIAQTMLKELMSIRQAELDVTRKYLKRFQKILPANKVARFFQLENKLDSVIDFELASEIPLVPLTEREPRRDGHSKADETRGPFRHRRVAGVDSTLGRCSLDDHSDRHDPHRCRDHFHHPGTRSPVRR
ncbi:MAG: hypothetical protein WBP10_13575 [Thermoanaerobaculia bacterium]